jgi:hypothetical protein
MSPSKGRDIAYRTAHERVWALWGKASEYRCIHCGSPAQEWAYDGTDPEQLVELKNGKYPLWYSPYPEFYYPACIPCHRVADHSVSVCRHGHEMTPENIYTFSTRPNRRVCRKCKARRDREQYLKRKASA